MASCSLWLMDTWRVNASFKLHYPAGSLQQLVPCSCREPIRGSTVPKGKFSCAIHEVMCPPHVELASWFFGGYCVLV